MSEQIDVADLTARTLANIQASIRGAGKPFTSQELTAHVGNLKDKVIVITGGASGIGRGFVIEAAKAGAKIVIGDMNLEACKKVAGEVRSAGGQALAHSCNVTSWESQRELFKAAEAKYGHIDIVIPCAGITERFGLELDTLDEQGNLAFPELATLNVNLLGSMYTVKYALYYLRKHPERKGRAIVMIGSCVIPSHAELTSSSDGVVSSDPERSVLYNREARHPRPHALDLFRAPRRRNALTAQLAHAHGIRTAMIAPWFSPTGIIEPFTRIGLVGLPMCDLDEVVRSVIAAASNPTIDGDALAIDPSGVISFPMDARPMGPASIYDAFGKRAAQMMNVKAFIQDIVTIVQLYSRGLALPTFKFGGALALALYARRRYRLRGHP